MEANTPASNAVHTVMATRVLLEEEAMFGFYRAADRSLGYNYSRQRSNQQIYAGNFGRIRSV
jgi:hypothetical protein